MQVPVDQRVKPPTMAGMADGTQRRNAREAVYEVLRRRVVTLELLPGAPLSEHELAAALGTSRTPVREGLILLAQEGLVQVFPKVGSFVSRVDPARVAEAQFVREALELAALEDLPAAPDPVLAQRLRDNVRRQRETTAAEEFFHLDEEFHRDLMALSGRAGAWSVVVAAKAHLDRARRLGLQEEVATPAALAEQHAAVLDAALAGDADGARRSMRAHLRAVLADVERIRARSPELFASDPTSRPVRRSVAVWD